MNLQDYMRKHGLSNRAVARQTGADRVQVSRWRRGVTRPGRDWWTKLVDWSNGEITEDVTRTEN